jgi:hypothetical protein
MTDDHYTLLGVRPDGAVPVVDLVVAANHAAMLKRARSFLEEHASCARVEVWLDGRLVREIGRETPERNGGALPLR